MMKVLYIKMVAFFKAQWWIGVLFGVLSGLWCFPPNIINFNRVKGIVEKVYEDKYAMRVTGKGTFNFDEIVVVLKDSSKYYINVKNKSIFDKTNMFGKDVEITYVTIDDIKSIRKLVVSGDVVFTENKWLVILFFLSVLWGLLGGIGEVFRIWKSL